MVPVPAILIFVTSIASLAAAFGLYRWLMAQPVEKEGQMQFVAGAIREGAEAYLSRQNRTIGILAVVTSALLFVLYAFIRQKSEVDPAEPMMLATYTVVSFILGALCSGLAGYVGMTVAVRANIRTAAGAVKSLNHALQAALRGGSVAGFVVIGVNLLGVLGLTLGLQALGVELTKVPLALVGFAFGASFVALFAQLGGGIYTKAADVGADLVGKVEAGIPEDDPRNPAVIADLVGDNVGDCAGRGADIFESIAAENIGAMILAATLASAAAVKFTAGLEGVILFPMVVASFGLVGSFLGVLAVRTKEGANPMDALNMGLYVTMAVAGVGTVGSCYWLLSDANHPNSALYFSLCGVIGLVTSFAFVWITQYYTEYRYRPVKSIVDASVSGPATNVINGLAVGMESTGMAVIVIGAAILTSYFLGDLALGGTVGGGLFGTAVATMGMLSTAGYILAMDNFGPITDNAGGIAEMSGQDKEVRERTDLLDSVGNTTKAVTKGYAIGSASLAAFLLFSAYIDEVNHYGTPLKEVDLANPMVFVGALAGGCLVFVFASLALRAVSRAAQSIIEEVRRQFREKPGILLGTEKPSYSDCVDIVTRAALSEMALPGILVVGTPIVLGLGFQPTGHGHEVVAGMLIVGTIVGILMALFLNNAGGAWDNAKKYIEMTGGKRTDPHKAAVVGDTVGDPFKDTAGPSIHVLIKLLATVSLVLAPFFLP